MSSHSEHTAVGVLLGQAGLPAHVSADGVCMGEVQRLGNILQDLLG